MSAAKIARDRVMAFVAQKYQELPRNAYPMPRPVGTAADQRIVEVRYPDWNTYKHYTLLVLAVMDDGMVYLLEDRRESVRKELETPGHELPSWKAKPPSARADLRNAFQEQTDDWPLWFLAISFPRNTRSDAIITMRGPDRIRMNIPMSVWRTAANKARFYRPMTSKEVSAHHGGIVLPHATPPEKIRERVFDWIENVREQRARVRPRLAAPPAKKRVAPVRRRR